MDIISDFAALRLRVRSGECRGAAFREMVEEHVRIDQAETGYDEVDEFVNELLFVGEMPEPAIELGPEMVEYYKTPARMVFEWTERMAFGSDDVFVDLGSGLGQVAMLVNLLTGIPAWGVEIEPAYCDYARSCAHELGLCDVSFITGDVREVDVSEGTIFFLYTPFTGEILQTLLERLQAIERPIRIISFGPCTEDLVRMGWLSDPTGPEISPPENWQRSAFLFRTPSNIG
jgi:SAM-dependent methyltransferase